MNKNGEQRFSALRTVAMILANLTAILSANYIVFYILDHFNPGFHFVVRSEFFLTKYLHFVIPVLMLLTALLYLLLYAAAGCKAKRFQKKNLIWILVIDIILAGAFAMTVNARAFGWVKWLRPAETGPVAIATRVPTQAPTEAPTPEPTDAPAETPISTPSQNGTESQAPAETPEPTEAPTPEPTPIPGLLGDKYKEKFSEGEPVVTEPNTSETLADGTVRTLIYTYVGKSVAFDLYHYQNGKQEYQIADLYVRDLEKLTAVYENDQGHAKDLKTFARDSKAILAINSDYFSNNANDAGLIIRNGMMIRNRTCKYSDLLVIYQDGTVRGFDVKKDRIDNNEILGSYPYHSFYFGPSLLDENGAAREKFTTLNARNPRTAFGYYEPGHYAFICVLGDRTVRGINGENFGEGKAPGMTLDELAALCVSLGMKVAYNFDGGGSSGMYWNEHYFGHNSRITGDILAIVD